MPACRSCGAEIIWALTEKGKRMPVDPEPVPHGNLFLRKRENGAYDVRPAGDLLLSERYVSHFSSCPAAATHRKKS